MTNYSTTCAAEMRCQLSFYGEVNASISVVSYFDYLSKFDDNSLDIADTLLFFVLRMAESISSISADYMLFLC